MLMHCYVICHREGFQAAGHALIQGLERLRAENG
jgi:hypothetical protein